MRVQIAFIWLLLTALVVVALAFASPGAASTLGTPLRSAPARDVAPPAGPDSIEAEESTESDASIYDAYGGAEVCHLYAHLDRTGSLMDASGWISNCLPDPGPYIYSTLRACVVATPSSGWYETSCNPGGGGWRYQIGFVPHYSYHAGWTCSSGVYYRARVYGAFAVATDPGAPGYNVTTSSAIRCP